MSVPAVFKGVKFRKFNPHALKVVHVYKSVGHHKCEYAHVQIKNESAAVDRYYLEFR